VRALLPSLLLAGVLAPVAVAPAAEREEGVVLKHYADYGAALEVSRRMLSPVTHDRVLRTAEVKGLRVGEHQVDLAGERYVLYVPKTQPAAGYGVIVHVSPFDEPRLGPDWRRQAEQRGLILVSAYDAGNDHPVVWRRVPLALHGLAHVQAEYRVDPERVYVSGFSGGGRVAQRIALAWPDLFRGALLMAGSDELGVNGLVPPPDGLMELFQTRSRIVFATGNNDRINIAKDAKVIESLEQYCVSGISVMRIPRTEHWMPEGRALARALDMLEEKVTPAPDHAACREAQAAKIGAALDRAEGLIESGDLDGAGQVLKTLDDSYGGMASPRLERITRWLDDAVGAAGG
jgi:pimeloyl-ACP methyl ester carboxylesterase